LDSRLITSQHDPGSARAFGRRLRIHRTSEPSPNLPVFLFHSPLIVRSRLHVASAKMCGILSPWMAAVFAALTLAVGPARAESPNAPQALLLFLISKSENKNQVEYAIRVDDRCQPLAPAPVFAYWLMREKGPGVTEPLLSHELDAYGIASQIATRTPDGVVVQLVLRAVRGRPIAIRVSKNASGACQALSTVAISGAPAHLYDVYAKLKWPFGVEYLLLEGWSLDGTRIMKEKLAE
jgi:hypothetical protein